MFACKRCKEGNVPCIFMLWLDYRMLDSFCKSILLPIKTVLRCYFFVYRALAYSECLCGLAHCSVAINDVVGNTDGTLLDIVLQKKTPKNCFYILCKSSWGYDCLKALCLGLFCTGIMTLSKTWHPRYSDTQPFA